MTARTVVLGLGVTWRRLGIPRLEALIGKGVYYGAGAGEARAVAGRHVSVVGGGNSAGQSALHLAKHADEVTLLVRGEGDGHLEAVVIRDRKTGEVERISSAALFVLIGARPHTDWLEGAVARDHQGFILTGQDLMTAGYVPDEWPLPRPPLLLETSIPGVFAAPRKAGIIEAAPGRRARLSVSGFIALAPERSLFGRPDQSRDSIHRYMLRSPYIAKRHYVPFYLDSGIHPRGTSHAARCRAASWILCRSDGASV